MKMETEHCSGCGGKFRKIKGPVHKYMASSPGCWAAFGEVLAREYSEPELLAVHRLSVDAYAVQHPGSPSRQSIQSVGVHLMRLCLFLEHDLAFGQANDAMLRAGKNKAVFFWLEPPVSPGRINVGDVVKAGSVAEHEKIARAWAQDVWNAWSFHHDQIGTWLAEAGLK